MCSKPALLVESDGGDIAAAQPVLGGRVVVLREPATKLTGRAVTAESSLDSMQGAASRIHRRPTAQRSAIRERGKHVRGRRRRPTTAETKAQVFCLYILVVSIPAPAKESSMRHRLQPRTATTPCS